MSDIYHQCHKNHLQERNTRHKEIDSQILSRTRIYQNTHQDCPPCRVSLFRIHHSECDSDKQVPCQYRNCIWKRFSKCLFITRHANPPSSDLTAVNKSPFTVFMPQKKLSCGIKTGYSSTRLGGFEPPLLPPEGSALSPELQTHTMILHLKAESYQVLLLFLLMLDSLQ